MENMKALLTHFPQGGRKANSWRAKAMNLNGSRRKNLSIGEESIVGQIESEKITPDRKLFNASSHIAMSRNRLRIDVPEMLLEISKQAIVLDDLGQFLVKAAEIIRESCDFSLVQIWTPGPRKEELLLSSSAPRIPADSTDVSAIRSAAAVCGSNGSGLEKLHPGNDRGIGSISEVSTHQHTLPLRNCGKLLGLLSIESSDSEAFPPEQNALIERAASIIAAAFDKFKAVTRASRSYEYLQAILNSASNLAIISTDSQGYIFAGSSGIESIFQLSLQSILGRDILTLFTDEGFRRDLALYMAKGNASLFAKNGLEQATPDGKCYLDVSFQRMSQVENEPVGFLCLAIDVTVSVLLQQKLEALSITDDLTGLSNRRSMISILSNEIKRSRRYHRTFSLCFFDLDGFKQYNDANGHLKGDKALVRIANLMRALTRMNIDTCYRFGGDELAILMPETTAQNAVKSVEKILSQIRKDFDGALMASVGIAEFDPAIPAESMMELADKAMYKAKANGGNQIIIAMSQDVEA
jgi:diguanylate cyclase (GGDEF)-like protein/PAS domain S-box-containing protein